MTRKKKTAPKKKTALASFVAGFYTSHDDTIDAPDTAYNAVSIARNRTNVSTLTVNGAASVCTMIRPNGAPDHTVRHKINVADIDTENLPTSFPALVHMLKPGTDGSNGRADRTNVTPTVYAPIARFVRPYASTRDRVHYAVRDRAGNVTWYARAHAFEIKKFAAMTAACGMAD